MNVRTLISTANEITSTTAKILAENNSREMLLLNYGVTAAVAGSAWYGARWVKIPIARTALRGYAVMATFSAGLYMAALLEE